MWIFRKDILKTIAIKDAAFDLIHTVIDGWLNIDYPNHLLFEANGVSYIATDINNDKLGFDDTVTVQRSPDKEFFQLRFNGSQWIFYNVNKANTWKKHATTTRQGNWFADLSEDKIKPYLIESGSEPITFEREFKRLGSELFKSDSLLGVYTWQGFGSKDDIIVGKRKYKHVFESDDFFATETIELTQVSGDWVYNFKGVEYIFESSELPLSNFIMTSDEGDINMIFIELVTIIKDVMHYDGGAQIVD